MSNTPVIELHDVRFSYDHGATWALDGIDLTILQGERICLTGANGSGKSTLSRVIAGLVAPDSGTVTLLRRPCRRIPHGPSWHRRRLPASGRSDRHHDHRG